jgi:hypothetical protein
VKATGIFVNTNKGDIMIATGHKMVNSIRVFDKGEQILTITQLQRPGVYSVVYEEAGDTHHVFMSKTTLLDTLNKIGVSAK